MFRSLSRTLAAAAAILLLTAGMARAVVQDTDELRLRDGTTVRGKAVTLDDSSVVFRSSAGIKIYNRADVAVIVLGGVAAPVGDLPPGITPADGFKVASWHTFRRITNFGRGEDAKFIPDLRLTADGSRIGFNSHKGLFTINADGTGLNRVTDIQAEYWDMTPDAKRFVWYHRDRGLYVVNGDGAGSQKLPGELAPWALRITARGDKAILWAGDRGALYAVNTDGSDIKQITNMKAIAKAHGTVDENGNHFRAHTLQISDDGSRAILQFLWDLYAVDSSGVRRLTNFTTYGLTASDLSPDGSHVAWLDNADPAERRNITVVDWNGGGKRAITGPAAWLGSVQVINDGTVMGFYWESQSTILRLFHPEGAISDLEFTGAYGANPPGMGNAAISANGRRIAFTTEGQLSTDQGRPNQLWICDVKPASIEGFPTLTGIGTFPKFVLTDGSTRAVASASSSDKDPMATGAFMYPKNQILDRDIRYYSYGVTMNDAGQNGDEKAGDGKFANGALALSKFPKELDPGPVMLRVWIRSKTDRMLVVDLEGMEMRRP